MAPKGRLAHRCFHFTLYPAIVEARINIGPQRGHHQKLRRKIGRREGRQLHYVQKINLIECLARASLADGGAQAAVYIVGNEAQALGFELPQVGHYLRELGVANAYRAAAHHNDFGIAVRGQQQR